MSFLEVNNIEKSYGKTKVLKGISFDVKKGEVLAVIGSSGSGKTTLLRCLNFLERPENGTISVNGETLFDGVLTGEINDSEIRRRRLHFGLCSNRSIFSRSTRYLKISLLPKSFSARRISRPARSISDAAICTRRAR